MTEQQFNNHWDEVPKLLTDLCYDINILVGLNTDDHLSEDYKKRLKDIIPHLDCIKVRVELLFHFNFLNNNTGNE